jgi:hypothetical protein
VVKALAARDHLVIPAPRDLTEVDLAGISAVVICATYFEDPRAVDLAQVEYLSSQDVHLVYPSIVGCDVIPWPYYDVKTECEKVLEERAQRWTILRTTQFHQLMWSRYTTPRRRPWLRVPAATRFQVLDPQVAAEAMAEAVALGLTGRLPDIGGPFAYEAGDLARSCLAAIGSRRLVIRYNQPGLYGAAMRAGANLTPNRAGGETWNEFLARRIAESAVG